MNMMRMGSSMRLNGLSGPASAARRRATLMLNTVKRMARPPHTTPMTIAGSRFTACDVICDCTSNVIVEVLPSKRPKWPLSRTALSAERRKLMLRKAVMQAKNTCHESDTVQYDAISSNANRRPPTGAPNATATPTATPAVTKSRRSLLLRKRLKKPVMQPSVVDSPCDSAAPMMAPMWIMGPSGPMGIPAPTAVAQDKNFTMSVPRLKTLGMAMPLRKAMHSGTPEPPAAGATYTTSAVEKKTRKQLTVTLNMYARATLYLRSTTRATSYLKCDSTSIIVYIRKPTNAVAAPTQNIISHLSHWRRCT
mmetsp:Transcript_23659/g.60756  ORF Transcript_23659/g.60756 Transcript_23659/m.60756 type:complete len:308 (-) Transcript_23659:313-1236(-)